MIEIDYESNSPEQTQELGAALGERLSGGEVIALEGPLGTGKTQLAKGLARGLGVPEGEPVISPTFVLLREYAGRVDLMHCDAYRLAGAEEFADLGLLEDAAERGAVLVIEWASRVREALPEDIWWIHGTHAGETSRRFKLRLPPAVAEALREQLASG